MTYDKNTGPLDMFGRVIADNDLLAVGSNSGIRLGRVIAVKTVDVTNWRGDLTGFDYSITVDKYGAKTKRQTFHHGLMGESKFWVVELDSDGVPVYSS